MRHLYHTRAEVLRLSRQMTDGVPITEWVKVPTIIDPWLGVPGELLCRIDLGFQRPGKDQPMPVVAGRNPDRVGVMVFDVTDALRAGDRIRCLDGPVSGTFEMRVLPDPAAGYSAAHHMEVQIVEVVVQNNSNLLTRPGPLT
jgi:hypothetical protein